MGVGWGGGGGGGVTGTHTHTHTHAHRSGSGQHEAVLCVVCSHVLRWEGQAASTAVQRRGLQLSANQKELSASKATS